MPTAWNRRGERGSEIGANMVKPREKKKANRANLQGGRVGESYTEMSGEEKDYLGTRGSLDQTKALQTQGENVTIQFHREKNQHLRVEPWEEMAGSPGPSQQASKSK